MEYLEESTLGRKPMFPAAIEKELATHCLELEIRFYGLTSADIRRLAYQLALMSKLPNTFSQGKATAGRRWLRNFLNRNTSITFRTPQGVSAARIKGFTKQSLKEFHDILEPELVKIKFNPCRVYNVDETGITTVQHKHTRVLALKGKKQIGALTTSERGVSVTVVMCMNANGHYVPPTPPGSIGKCHPSGWIQSHLFTQWLDHFITHVKPSPEDPVVLIFDGHYTHTRNLDVINKARENNISLVCLPPHSTHKIQPLDVAFMGPFKTYYCQEIEKWLRENPGRTISPYQIASLMGKAYLRTASMEVSTHGFEKGGIMPFDRHIFGDHDFAIHEKLETSVDRPLDDAVENPPIRENSPTPKNESSCHKSQPKIQILENICIKPATIRPVPVLPGPSGVKRKNSGAAALVSGSPYKNALEEAQSSPKAVKRNLGLSFNSAKPINKLKKPGSNFVRAVVAKKSATSKKRKGRAVVSSSSGSSDSEEDVLYAESDKEMDPEDVECIFCLEPFSSDKAGQHWIQCCKCYKWGHEACAGAESKKKYICDYCVDG